MQIGMNGKMGWLAAASLLALAGAGMGFGPGPEAAKTKQVTSVGVRAPQAVAIADAPAIQPGPAGVEQGAPSKGIKGPAVVVENNGAGLFDTPPYLDPAFQAYVEQLREENDPQHFERPASPPGYDPSKIVTRGPETFPPAAGGGTEAPDTFRFWRNRSLDGDIGGSASFSDRSNEPSLAGQGDSVFWTGNWYAARSANRGVSFQYINPYDNFPADGVNDVPAGASTFCCDQVTAHSTSWGMTIWLLQYSQNGSGNNVQRIAISNGTGNLEQNNWYYWDFSAQDFGRPSGDWLDFPDIMVSDSRVFFSTNVFNSADSYQGSAVWSIALSELADGGGFSWWYYFRTDGGRRLCQGSTSTGWFAHHLDADTIRLWNWLGDSSGATTYDVNHEVLGNGSMAFTGPGGCNWMGRADNRILGAARGGGDLLFMWMSSPQGAYLRPYVQTVRIRESDRAVLAQDDIFNNSAVWCYPAVASNAAGDYGGVVTYGDTNTYPSPYAFLADNYNSKGMQPATIAGISTGSTCQSVNRWGDYVTARRSSLGTNNFISASFHNSSTSGTQPMFTWFGREDDDPGPDVAHESYTIPGGVYDPGQSFIGSYVARNIGGSTSDTITVESRLSTNDIISSGDTLAGSVLRGPFGAGTQFSGNLTTTIPAALADGTYYAGLIHQTTSDGYFTNNYNDYNETPPTIQVLRRPEIDVTDVAWTGVPSRKLGVGQQIPWFSIFWRHHNNGTKVSNYDADIRASLNTLITTFDPQLVSYPTGLLGPLAPGGTVGWYNNFFTMPTTIAPGLYYIGVITSDPEDSDTGNNTAYDAVRVNVLWCDADVDRDGSVDLGDFFTWFGWWDLQLAQADIDGNPGLDLGDFFFFLQAWDNQCFAEP
jgi:hypothetical protein